MSWLRVEVATSSGLEIVLMLSNQEQAKKLVNPVKRGDHLSNFSEEEVSSLAAYLYSKKSIKGQSREALIERMAEDDGIGPEILAEWNKTKCQQTAAKNEREPPEPQATHGQSSPLPAACEQTGKVAQAAPWPLMPQFRWVERAFWTAFFLYPLFTGLLQYDHLPNESYEPERHELLESEYVDGPNGEVGERAEVWRDKETGEVYSRYDFADHRRAEGLRLGATCFFYGLIGCVFFAWVKSARQGRSFYELFGKATLCDLGFAAFFGLQGAFP
jgi:hypothetical protein